MKGYWVVEHYDDGEVIGCWTTEQPGITGPANLEEMLAELIWEGRNVGAAAVFDRRLAERTQQTTPE